MGLMISTSVIMVSTIMILLINFADESFTIAANPSKNLLTILFIYDICVAIMDIRKRVRDRDD